MLQELGRILAALVLLIARAIGRAYQGLRYLVRRARQTRAETSSAMSRAGRLLDIAALSLAADVFVFVEWWRRDSGPVAVAALIGLCLGVLGAAAVGVLLRGPVVQYALAGTEALRLTAVFAYAFAAPTMVTGGTSDPALGRIALAAIIALALVERSLWTVAARNRFTDAARYIGFLLPPILLLALLALIVGGIFALVLAQLALFVAMCLAFVITAPPPRPPRPVRPPKDPKPPKAVAPTLEMPAQRETPEPDSPDGSYTLYRPNSLKEPPESQ
jgi:hypothetical protein